MFGSAILKRFEHQRPLRLRLALSVMLLASVSSTIAHAADPARLAHDLKRDLGALRAQLELIDPWDRGGGRQTVAFNADLGDDGPAFQRHSLAAIVGAANRRVERLIQGYRRQGDDARAPAAEALRLVMLELQQQSERLARAADAPDAAVLRDQIEALLDRSEQGLSVLLDQPRHPPSLPGDAPPAPDADADATATGVLILRGGPSGSP